MAISKPARDSWLPAVWALALAYGALLIGMCLLRYRVFLFYEPEDLAEQIFMNWNLARLHFASLADYFVNNRNMGNLHFMPIALPVGLLTWILPGASAIFTYASLAVSLAAIPIYLLARSVLSSRRQAFIVALSYLFYAPKHSLVLGDGDFLVLLALLVPLAYWAIVENRIRLFTFSCALILLCRTETGFTVLGLCAAAALRKDLSPQLRKRASLLAQASAITLIVAFAFHVHFSYTTIFYNSSITNIGDGAGLLAQLRQAFDATKLLSAWRALYPVLGLSLLDPSLILLSCQDLAKVAIVDHFTYQRIHYLSAFFGALFVAYPLAIARLKGRFPGFPTHPVLLAVLGLSIASNFLPNMIGGPYPENAVEGKIADRRFIQANNIFDAAFYGPSPDQKSLERAVALVPAGAFVSTTGDLLPYFANRARVEQVLTAKADYLGAEYLVIHLREMYWGAGHYLWDEGKLRALIAELRGRPEEWVPLLAEDPVFVFKRVSKREVKGSP